MPPRPERPTETPDLPKSGALVSRNVTIDGHRTSVRLEPFMWLSLFDICKIERITVHKLCSMINARRVPGMSLTAAIRVFVMAYYRAAATAEGHQDAGHGTGAPFRNTPFDLPAAPAGAEAAAGGERRFADRRAADCRAADCRAADHTALGRKVEEKV